MKRCDVIQEISKCGGLIVANLGFPSRELYKINNRPENFYMLGSMGLASSIGLGLALSQTKRVNIIDGDGSILMNPGSLVTIAHYEGNNLCLVIIDNKAYGSTGNQPTYTSQKTDLFSLAKAAGNNNVAKANTVSELRYALEKYSGEKVIIIAETESGNKQVPIIPHDPIFIKTRFMEAVKNVR
jgi:sulfopyruvate decarboxylase subunit beta